tara:strand:- start:22055 stop:23968 length:1914 start_codon:yes stop_codon:yes gene_type:complete
MEAHQTYTHDDDTSMASPVPAFGEVTTAPVGPIVTFERDPDSGALDNLDVDELVPVAVEAVEDSTAEKEPEIIYADDVEDTTVDEEPPEVPRDQQRQPPARSATQKAMPVSEKPKLRPASASAKGGVKSNWTPGGTNKRVNSVESNTTQQRPQTALARSMNTVKKNSRYPWNNPPIGAPSSIHPFSEHLAPSRWRDKRLPEEKRNAQTKRLFEDAVRRQMRKKEVANAPIPRTRWSGRLPKERIDEGFERIANHAVEFVENRAAISAPELTQTGIMRYTGSHDEFTGELEPCQVLPERERNAALLKHHYSETAKRAVNKAERYEHYLSNLRPLSSRERDLLKLDDTPSIPMPDDLMQIAESELEAAREAKQSAKQKIRQEGSASAAAARSYKEARAASEEAKTAAMKERLKSARLERDALEAKTVAAREERRKVELEKQAELLKQSETQKKEMYEKFNGLAVERRKEVAEGDAKRKQLDKERAILKRKEMKALWEKQKQREAKYAEMMSSENDAGSALVMEVRQHRREVDSARRVDREKRLEAKNEERKANREKAKSYQAMVEEMEARQVEKQRERKQKLRERAVAMEAAMKQRRAQSFKLRRAERHSRGEVTPPKKKKSNAENVSENAENVEPNTT